jgi:hypothetical protein
MMERGNRSRRIDRATMLELTALNREVRGAGWRSFAPIWSGPSGWPRRF